MPRIKNWSKMKKERTELGTKLIYEYTGTGKRVLLYIRPDDDIRFNTKKLKKYGGYHGMDSIFYSDGYHVELRNIKGEPIKALKSFMSFRDAKKYAVKWMRKHPKGF